MYEDTLAFYEEVFLSEPPDNIWEDSEDRYEEKNFSYKNVNFY